jgi:hypothetical protein
MNSLLPIRIILIVTGFLLPGCQEVYIAQLDETERVMVVDGLITNQGGPHKVTLTLAGRFQQNDMASPVTGARILITTSHGDQIELHETQAGEYLTPAHFHAQQGIEYTLHIETLDGDHYSSEPQSMQEPVAVDSIFAQFGTEVFYNQSSVSNNVFQSKVEGAYAFVKTSTDNRESAYYRFESAIYLQHSIPISDVVVDNCWIKKPVNDFLGTDLSGYVGLNGIRQKMGFAPFFPNEIKYLGIADTLLFDNTRVFINKIFTLNKATYAYHKAKNDQINDQGRFFDPIAAQPPANIICSTDPEKLVLGIFEVSPQTTLTYRIRSNYFSRQSEIEMITDLEHAPDEGCLRNLYPDFWLH